MFVCRHVTYFQYSLWYSDRLEQRLSQTTVPFNPYCTSPDIGELLVYCQSYLTQRERTCKASKFVGEEANHLSSGADQCRTATDCCNSASMWWMLTYTTIYACDVAMTKLEKSCTDTISFALTLGTDYQSSRPRTSPQLSSEKMPTNCLSSRFSRVYVTLHSAFAE